MNPAITILLWHHKTIITSEKTYNILFIKRVPEKTRSIEATSSNHTKKVTSPIRNFETCSSNKLNDPSNEDDDVSSNSNFIDATHLEMQDDFNPIISFSQPPQPNPTIPARIKKDMASSKTPGPTLQS